MSKENDRSLRFYNEVLGLDHLHYGLWNEGEEVNLENFKLAQTRYEDAIVDQLPEVAGAVRVLDVGCGTGSLSQRLIAAGYAVEGLSPDRTQQENFTAKLGVPFHHCHFEDFKPEGLFDCLVFSESCQYIKPDALAAVAAQCLRPGGSIVICDYFTLKGVSGLLAKSGHDIESFKATMLAAGYQMEAETDITERTLPTLELAEDVVRRALIVVDILTEKVRTKRPWLAKIVMRLSRKKRESLQEQRVLIDAEAFRKHKQYLLLRYRVSKPMRSVHAF